MDPFWKPAHEALISRRAVLLGRELSDEQRRELADIEAALARLSSGSYGHCEQCGRAIGRQRLRAVPEARHCASCG